MTGLAACAAPAPGRPDRPLEQVIADPALAAYLAETIGLPDAAAVVSDDGLSAITALTCDGQTSALGPIASLAGIEELPALNELNAPHNAISDLTPLASLPRLGTLTLTDNAVSDLSPWPGSSCSTSASPRTRSMTSLHLRK